MLKGNNASRWKTLKQLLNQDEGDYFDKNGDVATSTGVILHN